MSQRVFIAAIVAARFLSAQASPPSAENSSALLAQAREKILRSTSHLPKYTCLETIDRTYYVPRPAKAFRHPMTEVPAYTCIGIGSNFRSAGYLALNATDRLRVDVAVAGEREIDSWPGASSFDTRPIYQMIPFGPVSTGSFGTYLLDLFANRAAQFNFIGRKAGERQDVFEYSFRVPLEASHLDVKGTNGWKATGYSGSFEINAATAELARLVIGIQFTDRDESLKSVSKSPQLGAALPSGISLTLALMSPIDTRKQKAT